MTETKTSGYPPCPACNSPDVQKFDSISEEDVAVLGTPEELESFPGLVRLQTVMHRAHAGGLLASYNFDVDVLCSNRNHRHAVGIVVRTFCGVVMCLGMKCVEDNVEDAENIRRQQQAAKNYREYQAVVLDLVQRLPALIAQVRREVGPLISFRDAILNDSVFESLGRAMRARLELEGSLAERGSVFVDDRKAPLSLKTRSGRKHGEIVGLPLFVRTTETPYYAMVDTEVLEVAKETRGWKERKPTARRARQLREQLGELEKKAQALLRWRVEAEPFLSEENLKEALFSVGLSANVEVATSSLRCRRLNGTIVLDGGGSRFIADKEV